MSQSTIVAPPFIALARTLFATRLQAPAQAWFDAALSEIGAEPGRLVTLARAMGGARRRLGTADLSASLPEQAAAEAVRPGLDLTGWSLDQIGRAAFLCASWTGDAQAYAALVESFAETADVNELIALYRAFAVLPGGERLLPRAREATRTAIQPIFEAIAHRNPYPLAHYDEDAWNQMVVKAVFIGATLWPIQGLDRRANPRLAAIFVDLAHERWAAGRPISGEVWRCVAAHPGAAGLAAMARVAETGDEREKRALALALAAHPAEGIAPPGAPSGDRWSALYPVG